jgi:hypothetical protein
MTELRKTLALEELSKKSFILFLKSPLEGKQFILKFQIKLALVDIGEIS